MPENGLSYLISEKSVRTELTGPAHQIGLSGRYHIQSALNMVLESNSYVNKPSHSIICLQFALFTTGPDGLVTISRCRSSRTGELRSNTFFQNQVRDSAFS